MNPESPGRPPGRDISAVTLGQQLVLMASVGGYHAGTVFISDVIVETETVDRPPPAPPGGGTVAPPPAGRVSYRRCR